MICWVCFFDIINRLEQMRKIIKMGKNVSEQAKQSLALSPERDLQTVTCLIRSDPEQWLRLFLGFYLFNFFIYFFA